MTGHPDRGVPVRLLLVEDSENDAMLLLRELRRGGYEPHHERVYTPEGMGRALEEAEARGEPYEVVISDYYMPRFRAPDALELLRGLGYDVPFIVVSGKIGEDAAVGIMKAGADDYLTKENMARLCPAIGRELKEAAVRGERARAEEALARSEIRFRRLVEQAADAMFVHDLEGRFVDVNRRACESLGYDKGELLGMSAADVEVGHDPGSLKGLWEEVSSGAPLTLEGEHRRKDGSVFPVEVRVGVFEGGGRPLVLALARDITARKEVEEELRRSEERYRTFIDQSTEGIWRFELEVPMPVDLPEEEQLEHFYRYAYLAECNDAMARMYGFESASELVGARVGDLLPRSGPGNVEFLRAAVDAGYRIKDGETREPDRDGNERVILNNLSGILEGGRLVRVWGTQRDVTGSRKTEEALRESRENLQAILDNTTAVIYVKDAGGRYVLVNRRFEELFHTTKDRVVGKTDHDLFPGESADLFRKNDLEVLRSETPLEAEETVLQDDGVHTYVSVKFPLKGPDGSPYATCGISTDITRRKETESRAAFLADLDRTLQPITDPDEVMATAARMLGGHVGADRCAYAEVEADEDHFRITGDYTRGVPSIVGRFAMSQFGQEALRLSRENEPYVVHDAEEDGRVTGADLEAYRRTGIRAVISAPLHKGGRFVAGMAVHQKTPRRWTGEEVGLVVAVANRCWESIERARAARDLSQSEELYRNVVEQAAESIFLLDLETLRVLEANAALGTTLGYEPEELKGMSIYEISAHDRESVDGNVRRALREGRLPLGLRQYRHKDGGLVDVEISISTVPYEGRRAMCVVAHDVTGRLRAERALGEIREAERNRIARELHDSILQDIVYALQEIQILQVTGQNGGDLAALGDAADALRRSVEGLRGAIFELRLEQTLESSLVGSLENLVDLNRRMSRGAYEIELVVGEGVPERLPGGREIVRIVQEALTNVRRHAGAGHVRVEVGAVGGGTLHAEVRDDGRGFDPGLSRTGVGSDSMRQRALDLGGEVEVRSEPGGGTRVLLRVPLPRPDGEDPPQKRGF